MSSGKFTTSTYDAVGRLTERLLSGAGSNQYDIVLSYNANNQVKDVSRFYGTATPYGLSATTSYTYDSAARLTNLQHRNNTPANIANYTYVYDNHSRLTSETRNGTTVTYTYDNTDQLTADGTTTVTYDANGNRNNGSYTTGTGNRLSSDGTWTYTYDDEGNLTKKSKGASAETWTYGYDQRNELLWVKHAATDGGAIDKQVDFKYDVYGNRIEKSYDDDGAGAHSATVTRFAYDCWKNSNQYLVGNENNDVWADLDGSSSLTTRYLRSDVIDEVFARVTSGGTAYLYLPDRLGSIRDIIDTSANVKDTIGYNGFGGITSETDSSFRGRYAWTGREIDTEINLQYNRARYYDALTGRWISQDPLGLDAGDSNLYRYAGNRTLSELDASGLDFIAVGTSGVGSTSGIAGHYSLAYFTTTEKVLAWFNKSQNVVASYMGRPDDRGHAGAICRMSDGGTRERVFMCVRWEAGVDLVPDEPNQWRAKYYIREWVNGYSNTFVSPRSKQVLVSVIRYTEGGEYFYPVYEDSAGAVQSKWKKILETAKNYQWAEQPDNGIGPPLKKTHKFTNWPNSRYNALGTNSNTFIRYVSSQNGLPSPDSLPLPGSHPGDITPNPITSGYFGTSNDRWWFDARLPPYVL